MTVGAAMRRRERAVRRRGVAPRWWLLLAASLATSCSAATAPTRVSPPIDLAAPSFLQSMAAQTDAPYVGGNRAEILLDGDGTFPHILSAIRGAERSITFAQYFFDEGPISDEIVHALAERCANGVEVHVLLDAVGGSGIRGDLVSRLTDSGCEFAWFRPVKVLQFLTPWELLALNHRSHCRILVIDGNVGFTGGYGISEAWMGDGVGKGRWRDTNVRIEGPVVAQLQAAFVQDWWSTTGTALVGEDYFPPLRPAGDVLAQTIKSSPGRGASEAYMMFFLAIEAARRSIYVTNPYFVIDDDLSDAFVRAAARGVQVVVVIPGQFENQIVRVDQNLVHYSGRGELGPLLQGGVRIFEYKPALLHAKTMVVDGMWSTIGSTNLDPRSFELNEELNVSFFDAGVAAELEKVFWEDVGRSEEITYAAWHARGLTQRFMELFAWPARSQL
jgi:cardiolipin synthase